MNSEQAKAFVEHNARVLSDSNMLSRCVDGRYEGIENMPMISKPGADAGDVMSAFAGLNLLNIDLENEVVLQSVVDMVGGPDKFQFHTDTHADQAVLGLGCGHLKQAKLDPVSYGLKQEQIDFIFNQLPSLAEQGAHQEILPGDHAEQAVIVVSSESRGVEPIWRDGENLNEAFIYQQTHHAKQLEKLAQLLQEKIAGTGKAVEFSEIHQSLLDAFGKQLSETLKRLANGLPVFTATIDEDGNISIS